MKRLIIIFFISYLSLDASNWRQIDDLENHIVKSMNCPDSNNCYILAQFTNWTRLYKSTDQGNSWSIIYQSEPIKDGSFLINSKLGYSPHPNYYFMAMWDYPVIKKSSDGGITFKNMILDSMDLKYERKIYSFNMLDTNIGIAFSPTYCFSTFDGWETFEKFPSFIGTYRSSYFLNDSIALMTYSSGLDSLGMLFGEYNFKRNTNKQYWDFKKLAGNDRWPSAPNIFFITHNYGFACGELNTDFGGNTFDIIYRTKDAGHNWELLLYRMENPPYGLQDIAFYDAKNGVAVGQGGKIWITNDSGNTWIMDEIPPEMTSPLTMKVCWAGHFPITGTYAMGGGVFRYEGDFFDFTPDTTDTTDIEEYIKNIFGEIEVKANLYRSQLYVSISDEKFRKYKLQIFDIMGNVAAEHELSSGVGTLYVPYDISGLMSGAYLYMISCEGVVVKTGKLVSINN